MIESVVIRDQEESKYDPTVRTSIVKRGLTNVKNLFEMASPMRANENYEDIIHDDSKQTKASMQYNSKSLMKFLQVRLKYLI